MLLPSSALPDGCFAGREWIVWHNDGIEVSDGKEKAVDTGIRPLTGNRVRLGCVELRLGQATAQISGTVQDQRGAVWSILLPCFFCLLFSSLRRNRPRASG